MFEIQTKKFYTAMNEAVFYECIGNNEKRVKIFLEQILKEKILDIKIQNVKLLKDFIETKEKILDYLVLTEKGYINVEINNSNSEWIIKRNVSYVAKVLSNSIEKSKTYNEVVPVIQINLSRLGKSERGYSEYLLKGNNIKGFDEILTNIIKIYVVNIDFYKEMVYNGNNKFIKENYLLCAMDLTLEEIDNISERNEILMEFRNDLEKINESEDFVKWMSWEKESEKIMNTYKQEAYDNGIKQGYDDGIKQGYDDGYDSGYDKAMIQTAINMKKENLDVNTISRITKLSIEQINEL